MSNMPRHLIQDRYQLYIGGAWCDASDGATFDSFCPANGERLCSFAELEGRPVKGTVPNSGTYSRYHGTKFGAASAG